MMDPSQLRIFLPAAVVLALIGLGGYVGLSST
jgi:hypothetical protein